MKRPAESSLKSRGARNSRGAAQSKNRKGQRVPERGYDCVAFGYAKVAWSSDWRGGSA